MRVRWGSRSIARVKRTWGNSLLASARRNMRANTDGWRLEMARRGWRWLKRLKRLKRARKYPRRQNARAARRITRHPESYKTLNARFSAGNSRQAQYFKCACRPRAVPRTRYTARAALAWIARLSRRAAPLPVHRTHQWRRFY